MPTSRPTPRSTQEEICHAFLSTSGSACWCFIPDKYGSPESEAADFVWMGEGCIVFFYMTSSKRKSLGQCNRHNFEQAARWLQHWRAGVILKGRNRFQDFSVTVSDVRHIAVISVVNCRRGKVEYHPDRAKALGITAAATLTEGHLAEIARLGLTMADILFFINQVRLGHHTWPLRFATRSLKEMIAKETLPRNRALGVDPRNFQRGMALLGNLRIPTEGVLRQEQHLTGNLVSSLLVSDLMLPELFHCARTIAAVTQVAAPPPWGRGRGMAIAEVRGERYSFRAQAVTAPDLGMGLKTLGAHISSSKPTDSFQFDGLYRVDGDPIFSRYSVKLGEGPGNSEALLDAIATAEGLTVKPRQARQINLNPRFDAIGGPS